MITKEMITKGYEQGIVRLVAADFDGSVACRIGDEEFFFMGGPDRVTLVEALAKVPREVILKNIFAVLEDWGNMPEEKLVPNPFLEGYRYCEEFLRENLEEVSEKDLAGIVEKNAGQVALSSSDGTLFAVSKLTVSLGSIERACEAIVDVNKGTYKNGQEPVRFVCGSSPELAANVRDLVGMVGKLVEAAGMDRSELAKMIFEGNFGVAHEVSKLVEREKNREEIASELEEAGMNPDVLSEDEMDELVEKFEEELGSNFSYIVGYSNAAQKVVNDFVKGEYFDALLHGDVDAVLADAAGRLEGQNVSEKNPKEYVKD